MNPRPSAVAAYSDLSFLPIRTQASTLSWQSALYVGASCRRGIGRYRIASKFADAFFPNFFGKEAEYERAWFSVTSADKQNADDVRLLLPALFISAA